MGFLPYLFVSLEAPALGLRASEVVLCQGTNPGARSPGAVIFSVTYLPARLELPVGWWLQDAVVKVKTLY